MGIVFTLYITTKQTAVEVHMHIFGEVSVRPQHRFNTVL